ncbi:MAG TPA: phytanoyl-CoA dioxygenase family protein [Thermoanaerobaculia bacterium]|nr:phytanoyl-CoA dioxygenase family protein [Thermoanaerobaculia bacterium]
MAALLTLSMALVEAFRRDGHVVVPGLASRDEVESYRPIIASVVEDVARRHENQGRIDDYSKLFTQVTNVWRLNDAARRIVFSKRFAAVAAELLGSKSVRLYHDQALFKPPGAGRTPWHQDRYYWPLDTDLSVTMWLPLVDVDEAMGPMRFASGSHRSENLGDLAISDDTDRRLATMIEKRGWRVSSAPVHAGDATFHAGGTIHSAGANNSDRTREVLTVIYYAAGTRAAVPANDNQRVDLEVFLPGVRPGEEAKSELNPVLFP